MITLIAGNVKLSQMAISTRFEPEERKWFWSDDPLYKPSTGISGFLIRNWGTIDADGIRVRDA